MVLLLRMQVRMLLLVVWVRVVDRDREVHMLDLHLGGWSKHRNQLPAAPAVLSKLDCAQQP